MDDNEKLKALVLARAGDIWMAQQTGDYVPQDSLKPYRLWMSLDGKGWDIQSKSTTVSYWFREDLPASDPVWALVAPILGIQIEK